MISILMVLKSRWFEKPRKLAIGGCALVKVFINTIEVVAELCKREADIDLWEVVTWLLNDYWPFLKWRH